jgi:hypothetical protein
MTNILLNLNLEHHIERHYEIETNRSIWLQHIDVEEEFFEDRLDHCLKIPEDNPFNEFILEEFGLENAKDDFEYLQNTTFTNFFKASNVDVPRCFKKTKTIRRSINEVEILKLNNYLMRQGKRAKTFKFLSNSINTSFNNYIDSNKIEYNSWPNWKQLFVTLNYMSYQSNYYSIYNRSGVEFDNYGYQIIPEGSHINFKWLLNPIIVDNIDKMLPMFSFYIYKVDKKIFKNTRGKSGKFTFIWKYVSQYKRNFLVMHWLMKELRLKPGRSLQNRVDATIDSLVFSPKKTWIWKVKKFSYNYVYYNCRKSLADTYRTVKN